MPIIKSGSKADISNNISEIVHSYRDKGTIGTSAPKDAKAAQKQAVAISMANARKYGNKFARGGMPRPPRAAPEHTIFSEGLIDSAIPGRTDKHNIAVPKGAYVIPADIVSGMRGAQGNTLAGAKLLSKKFPRMAAGGSITVPHTGMPRGFAPNIKFQPAVPGMPSLLGRKPPRAPKMPRMAAGGEVDEHIPIVAAGGEVVIHPEAILAKYGDLTKGHNEIDKWVQAERRRNIGQLRRLPPPKQ